MTDTRPARDNAPLEWSPTAKAALRTAVVFFLLLIVPLEAAYWQRLFTTDWWSLRDVFRLTVYSPQFVAVPKWGLASFANWGVAALVALVTAFVWGLVDRGRTQYDDLYYRFRVVLRYRLAIGVIAYGLVLAFELLFPRPTLSDLNTNYADFLPWRIYYLTTGVAAAKYQLTHGLLALAGAALLLYRPTATLGAAMTATILVSVVLAEFAFQIGEHVYASLLLLIALVVLLHDVPRLYDLLVRERPAKAETYEPVFATSLARQTRVASKAAVVLFALILTVDAAGARSRGGWQFPETPGLANAAGVYNVKEFVFNGRTLPYSLTDPVRWQNVVFERWNTLSIRIARPVPIRLSTPSIVYEAADSADYELAGNGGRHFYSYTIGAEGTLDVRGKSNRSERLVFEYSRRGDELLLVGADESGNALRVVLQNVNKQYLLEKGRRNPVTLY